MSWFIYQKNLYFNPKRQTHKMFKHIQTIRQQKPTNCLSVFEHFVELALKGLIQVVLVSYNQFSISCKAVWCLLALIYFTYPVML